VNGEVIRRPSSVLRPGRPVELKPRAMRRLQRAPDADNRAAIEAGNHMENAAIIVKRALELSASVRAEAAKQPCQTPHDADAYQAYVRDFDHIARRTMHIFGDFL